MFQLQSVLWIRKWDIKECWNISISDKMFVVVYTAIKIERQRKSRIRNKCVPKCGGVYKVRHVRG